MARISVIRRLSAVRTYRTRTSTLPGKPCSGTAHRQGPAQPSHAGQPGDRTQCRQNGTAEQRRHPQNPGSGAACAARRISLEPHHTPTTTHMKPSPPPLQQRSWRQAGACLLSIFAGVAQLNRLAPLVCHLSRLPLHLVVPHIAACKGSDRQPLTQSDPREGRDV